MNADKNRAYPAAVEALKTDGVVPPRVELRQCKYLNNVIEQDHRSVKKRVLAGQRVTDRFRVRGGRTLQGIGRAE
jgi:transposase-like protein